MSDFNHVETRTDLIEWLKVNLPSSSLHELEGEIIIHTGLTYEMNGELYPIESGDDE